ncbi:isochorismate synthase [Vibrio sp.]|uniref:isochorismate synthase n=1 Tax=Vibrio sp. TaxID=678 RepID=UPI00311F4A31
MSLFRQAIRHLIQCVKTAKSDQKRLVYCLQETPKADSIDWADAQPLYPKFYWQSRDADEEVVALGQLAFFSGPINVDLLEQGQRVWGGSPFNEPFISDCIPSSHFFILPLVELIRQGKQWSIAVNLNQNRQDILAQLQKVVTDTPLLPPLSINTSKLTHCPDKADWCDLVNKVLTGINSQEFKKVVLARKTTLKMNSVASAAQLLKSSRANNYNSFHFMFSMDESCSFVGSSPERLFVKHQQNLSTEALAGTVGRGASASKDMALANWLCMDTKNRHENCHVVDDIVERLIPYANEIDTDREAHLIKLRKVQHLKRNIYAHLKPKTSAVELLHTLKPTAAVAGLPRKEAMTFIQKHEPFNRGWYAGSLGFIGRHHAEFCVTIRSALVKQSEIELFTGAGIVSGSVAIDEWDELDKKMSTLLSLFDDTHELEVAS